MKCKFGVNDLRQRLDGSVIRYKGKPVYVRAEGNHVLYLYELGKATTKAPISVAADDEDLDVSTVPLGYCNLKEEVVYLTREPYRRYKQGVDEGSLHVAGIDGERNRTANFKFLSSNLEDCINGKYPPLEVSLKLLRNGERRSHAFSRDIAMNIDSMGIIRVFYKGQAVGWIAPNKNKVHVPTSDVAWIVSQNLNGFDWVVD